MARTLASGFLVLAIAASAAISGCQGAPTTQSPGTPPTAGTTAAPGSSDAPSGNVTPAPGEGAIAAARAAIDAADLADTTTLETLAGIRFTDEGAIAAGQAIQGGATGDALWAATWIYTAFGTDPEILVPVLSSADSTVRAMAAAALLAWGRREAADALVALLSSEGGIRGSEPPLTISAFAAATLDRFVDGPTIAAGATREERTAAWSTWLGANGASMQFDLDAARWDVP